MMEILSEIFDGKKLRTLSVNSLKHVFCIRKRLRFGCSETIEMAVIDTHEPLLWISMRLRFCRST